MFTRAFPCEHLFSPTASFIHTCMSKMPPPPPPRPYTLLTPQFPVLSSDEILYCSILRAVCFLSLDAKFEITIEIYLKCFLFKNNTIIIMKNNKNYYHFHYYYHKNLLPLLLPFSLLLLISSISILL
jgi:hypothetical protein